MMFVKFNMVRSMVRMVCFVWFCIFVVVLLGKINFLGGKGR